MKPCKHLDYTEGKYTDCVLRNCGPHYPNVQYWERPDYMVEGNPPGARNVQFCGQGRGRINEIFACYNGEMHCYDPETE